jgi:DNA-directed RNA polymerase specialized sigma24 family protein
MPTRTDEVGFATFVAAQRPLLQGMAYLMYGDVSRARAIVDVTMARLYDNWPVEENPRDIALRQVLDARPSQLDVPWVHSSRVELVDTATPGRNLPMGIVADLAALHVDQRRVLILHHVAQVPLPLMPPLVDRTLDEIRELARSARDQLLAADPDRARSAVLSTQLAEAIPLDLREGSSVDVDITHGKQLIRQRMLRRLAGTLAAVLVLVGVVIWAPRERLSASTSPPAPMPMPVQSQLAPPCGGSDINCQVHVLGTWRAEMADVVASYLDPANNYFDGVGHGSEAIYETPSFWDGGGGALGFNLFSRAGATVIYVQVASSYDTAVECGELTGQQCVSHRFMDGNSFTFTDVTYPSEGLEVQFSPNWPQVVTVVARDTSKGRSLDISRGDVMKLLLDSRLQLPHR